MFRPIKLLLSTCFACGIFSLLLFYIYTDSYSKKNEVSRVQRTRTIKKAVHMKENWNLAENAETPMPQERPTITLPTTSVQELTTKFVKETQNSSLNSINGGDSIDQLIEASLEKNKKRSHGDGDAPETTDVPEENDISEKEEETPSQTSSYNDETNVEQNSNKKIHSPESDNEEEDLELCPAKPPSLTGPLFVNQNIPKMEDLEKHISEDFGGWVKKGGAWSPTHCKARVKMALIVPFRKRFEQLAIFVRHMHPMLKRQQIDYRIIIVEQSGRTPFNRAILFNIGYKEALKFKKFNCFIFHDVDLIPEDDRNMYTCPTSPRHMSAAVDKFNYRLPYNSIFGGVEAFLRKDFEEINGFSNKFWGWGGEDDDLYQRVVSKGHHLTRPSLHIGRYKMIRIHHRQSSKADPNSGARVKNARIRMLRDGLNSLKYKVLKIKEEPMYTMVTVEVNPKNFKDSYNRKNY